METTARMREATIDPMMFVEAFLEAAPGTDIEMRSAVGEDAAPLVYIQVGAKPFVLRLPAARAVAATLERTMRKFPGASEVAAFPDMVMMLRAVADKIEAG